MSNLNFDELKRVKTSGDGWTLKDDIFLKDSLQNFANGLTKNIEEMNLKSEKLQNDFGELEIRLANIHNRINCAKMTRFVEEKVDDISVDNLLSQNKRQNATEKKKLTKEEFERRTIQTITFSVLKAFRQMTEAERKDSGISAAAADPLDPCSSSRLVDSKIREGDKEEGEDRNSFRKLCRIPPIIGTKEFLELYTRQRKTCEETVPSSQGPNIEENIMRSVNQLARKNDEDIQSTSSSRSIPPQDPTAGLTQGKALLEEMLEKMQETRRGIVGIEQKVEEKRTTFVDSRDKLLAKNKQGNSSKVPGEHLIQGSSSVVQERNLSSSVTSANQKHFQSNASNKTFDFPNQKNISTKKFQQNQLDTKSGAGGLFSSSSEEENEEEEKEKDVFTPSALNVKDSDVFVVVGERREATISAVHSFSPSSKSSNEKKSIVTVDASGGRDEGHIDEMPKPVFKPFSAAFSDRLTAVIQHGPPPTFSLNKPATQSKRPLSVPNISDQQEESKEPTKTLKGGLEENIASISNNEEMGGSAGVKARIAQIGAKIPVSRAETKEERGFRFSNESNAENVVEKAAPISSGQLDALKSRVKGPSFRRAPSHLGSLSARSSSEEQTKPHVGSEAKEQASQKVAEAALNRSAQTTRNPNVEKSGKALLPPPAPPPKKTTGPHHSIFSSSSSDDEFGINTGTAFKSVPRKAQPPVPVKIKEAEFKEGTSTELKHSLHAKKSIPNVPPKQRKGLFDDTDFDF